MRDLRERKLVLELYNLALSSCIFFIESINKLALVVPSMDIGLVKDLIMLSRVFSEIKLVTNFIFLFSIRCLSVFVNLVSP